MTNKLHFLDILHLSWINISQHKIRSAIIVATISILFGLLIGVSFVLNGLETTLLDASSAKTNGKFYITTYHRQINNNKIAPIDSVHEILSLHHATTLGTLTTYNFSTNIRVSLPFADLPFEVISSSAVTNFLTTNLNEVPADKVPVLAPAGGFTITDKANQDSEQENWLREQINTKYYIVGYLPIMAESNSHLWEVTKPGYSNDHTPTIPGGFNLLNLILGKINPGATASMQPILVDDGSGKVDTYINELTDAWVQAQSVELEEAFRRDTPTRLKYAIAQFDDAQDLIDYTTPSIEDLFGSSSSQLITSDLVGNANDIATAFHHARLQYFAIGAVILITAVLITIFTFSQLVDQDAPTIALYHSMGASTNNISLIYLFYLLELCALTIIAGITIGLIFSGLTTALNATAFAQRLQDFYLLSTTPHVSFIGISQDLLFIILAIIATAPIVLAFTQKHFSAQYVAKRLKAR